MTAEAVVRRVEAEASYEPEFDRWPASVPWPTFLQEPGTSFRRLLDG